MKNKKLSTIIKSGHRPGIDNFYYYSFCGAIQGEMCYVANETRATIMQILKFAKSGIP